MRWGLTIPPESFQNHHLIEFVKRAEELGYTDAWSIESFGPESFSTLAATAAVTARMRLGTAIASVFTRPAALIAMSASTVQFLSNGRFVLGLGLSTPTIVEQWMNIKYERPVTRLRETVAVLREMLTGKKVNFTGKTMRLNGFRLGTLPAIPPPLYVAAQGAQMLRVAGEVGDGLITNFVTVDNIPGMLRHFEEGAKAAGKDPSALDVMCRIVVVVDEDPAVVRAELKRSLTAYVTVPQYNKFFRNFGFEHEAEAAIAAWTAGNRAKAVESISDAMVESIYVFGNADHCRRRVEAYAAAGVKTVALWFQSFAPTAEERRLRIFKTLETMAPR